MLYFLLLVLFFFIYIIYFISSTNAGGGLDPSLSGAGSSTAAADVTGIDHVQPSKFCSINFLRKIDFVSKLFRIIDFLL